MKALKENGFTILELLLAVSMTSAIMIVVTGQILMLQNTYMEDLGRIKVQSNLTSASDIISMNIRQAGENLPGSFPALIAINGDPDNEDSIKIRRNLVPEVLILCSDVLSGQSVLQVSDNSLGEQQCLNSQVQHPYNVFKNFRLNHDNEISLYIHNRVTKEGEFIKYNSENDDSGNYKISLAEPLKNDYPALGTTIYILEEFLFEVDPVEQKLSLTINEDSNFDKKTVAFSINSMNISLVTKDGVSLIELNKDSAYRWKDIRNVVITISGEEIIKNKTISSSITSNFFPRNILSKD